MLAKEKIVSNRPLNISFNLNPALYLKVNNLTYKNKFLLDIFVHQRKVYRYYKAVTEYDEGLISEDELQEIEDTCVINLKSENINSIKKKINYLIQELAQHYPEELENLSYEELADLLQISSAKLNLYLNDGND